MKRSAFSAIILSALLGPVAAYANTEQITVTFPASASLYNEALDTSSPFAQFNPALGLLDSVTFSATGTAQTGGPDPNSIAFVPTGDYSDPILSLGVGATTFNKSATDTNAALLALLTGTGDITISAFDGAPNDSDNTTLDITSAELTYNYTPVVITPEPSSLALLATGLLAAARTARRRLSS